MSEALASYLQQHNISSEMIAFIISILPVLELRGGIIAAKLMGIPLVKAYFICLAGNMLPIPFVLLFIKQIFAFMKRFAWSEKLVVRLELSAQRKSASVRNKQLLGLFVFVAVPLPGTGGWTGALIASMLNIPFKKGFLSIFAGVIAAGIIMIILSYFIPGLFGF